MAEVGLVSVIAYIAVNLVAGGRMLLLGRQTREVPEICLGLYLTLGGAFGIGVGMLIHYYRVAPGWANQLAPLVLVGSYAGATALLVFVRRVFRPKEGWAAVACGLAALGMLAAFVTQGLTDGYHTGHVNGRAFNIGFAIRDAIFAWAAVESLLCYRMQRNRAKLGLANPMLSRRFLLWGLGCAVMVPPLTIHLVRVLVGAATNASPATTLGMSLVGSSSAILVWLAFFPPRRGGATTPEPSAG